MGTAANVGSTVHSATDTVIHSPGTALNSGTQGAVSQTQGQPLVAGAVAFGLGFLVASMFPGSQSEGQVAQKVQQMTQPAVSELKQAGQDAVSSLRDPALDGVAHVKEAAMSGVDQVRSTAQEVVGDTKEAVGEAGEQLADQTKNAAENIRNA